MNLVTNPWIPVVTMQGKPEFASLMQVFTEGEKYADLSVRPHERVALMRLLICIAQAALDGPADKEDWKESPRKLQAATKKYLRRVEGSFDLFHEETPFLQIADLESKELTPLSKLDMFLSTGNTATLFDHEANGDEERRFLPREAALMLITFQCFSPGGGLPITKWKEIKTGQVGNPDALCLTGGMYHTFLRSANLYSSICLNMLPKSTLVRHYGGMNENDWWGKPVWELYPNGPNDDPAIENATRTYLGRLVPMCRWIKIESDCVGIHCGRGFEYPVMERKVRRPKQGEIKVPIWPAEPTASVVLNKDGTERFVMGAKPDKAIWRELAALFIQRNEDSIGGPLVLQNPLPETGFDIHVCALVRDQASIENVAEAVYTISPKLLQVAGRALYEEEVMQAEWISRTLGFAVEMYRRNIDRDWDQRVEKAGKDRNKLKARLHSIASRVYWTAIEKNRHLLMAHVEAYGTDQLVPTCEAWQKAIHRAARDAYIIACGQETPRQIRAFALGWKKLFAPKSPVVEEQTEAQNTDGGEE